jgi:two-component system nitrogen regulation response regulator NtrX
LIGESPVMVQLREQVAMAAPTNGRVLIHGENGTGKELVARSVHALSRRAAGAFVEVNCAAIPEELIESELFGHVRGAFTGAVGDRRGKFEVADGGTIFLDEIGDMSLKTQAKVLRVLQEQVVEPVGGRVGVHVDVRVVAATNKSLQEEIQAGRFRDDLFYRLNVVPISVPPLRDRREDIGRLTEHFLAHYASEYGHRVKTVNPEALAMLQAYRWPGNVRELRNVLERLVIMVPGPVVTARDLAFLETTPMSLVAPLVEGRRPERLQEARDRFERGYILEVLAEQRGNITRSAAILGLERSNLYRKMRAFGIRTPRQAGSVRTPVTEGADTSISDPS